jgi:hypothetical protein
MLAFVDGGKVDSVKRKDMLTRESLNTVPFAHLLFDICVNLGNDYFILVERICELFPYAVKQGTWH